MGCRRGGLLSLGQSSRFLLEALPTATEATPVIAVKLLRGVFQLRPAGRAYRFAIEAGDISAISVSAHLWGRVDAARDALRLVDLQQHRLWLAETELKTDFGVVVAGGRWQLVLISLTDAERADLAADDFRRRGYAVTRKSVVRNGRTLHRLLLPGFETIDAALAARARIEKDLGIGDAWVWKAN